MSNNYNISPSWKKFRTTWIFVAIALFLFLFFLMLAGISPWGNKCEVAPTIVEKVVEKEKLVDNPELLTRIAVLEKENGMIASLKTDNAQIAGLKSNIADLTKSSGLVAGLQAKVKALEAVDLNFENPKLMSRIGLLETENSSIAALKTRILELESKSAEEVNEDETIALNKRIAELEQENGLIAGLKAKVTALEGIDINFLKPQDNAKLLQTINNLEVKALAIPTLESRIQELQAEKPVLTKRIDDLEIENGLIAGLKAKVSALEAVDINFMKPKDDAKLIQKINNLEIKTLTIPSLESRISELKAQNELIPGLKAKISALEAIDVNFVKPQDNSKLMQKINNLEIQTLAIPTLKSQISELKTENGLIPGLRAKVKALESIDINFINKNEVSPSEMIPVAVPKTAKLYFEPGSSRFPSDGDQSIANVIAYLKGNSSASVSLAGFHDASGNANWNRRLSSKRSNRVKQILLDSGISSSRINVDVPTQTLGTGSPEEARRVEVRVTK